MGEENLHSIATINLLLTNLSFSLFIYLLYLFISFYKMLLKILSTPLLHDLKILSHYCLLRYTLSTLHLQYTVPLACVRASCLFHASRHRCSVRNRDHATGSSTQRLSTLCLRCMIRTNRSCGARGSTVTQHYCTVNRWKMECHKRFVWDPW